MEGNKKLYVILAVLAAVLVGAIGFSRRAGQPSPNDLFAPEITPAPSVSASVKPATQTPKAGVAGQTKTYTELVKQYEGYRVQFDINCQAIPGNMTFKSGVSIMLDNRSGDSRSIKVGDSVYQIPGYGYRIVTLASSQLPKTVFLSCGSAVNVGQILLQK